MMVIEIRVEYFKKMKQAFGKIGQSQQSITNRYVHLLIANTKERKPSSNQTLADLESGKRKLAGKGWQKRAEQRSSAGQGKWHATWKESEAYIKAALIPGRHSLWLWCLITLIVIMVRAEQVGDAIWFLHLRVESFIV